MFTKLNTQQSFTSSLWLYLCDHQQGEDAGPQSRHGPPVAQTHPQRDYCLWLLRNKKSNQIKSFQMLLGRVFISSRHFVQLLENNKRAWGQFARPLVHLRRACAPPRTAARKTDQCDHSTTSCNGFVFRSKGSGDKDFKLKRAHIILLLQSHTHSGRNVALHESMQTFHFIFDRM